MKIGEKITKYRFFVLLNNCSNAHSQPLPITNHCKSYMGNTVKAKKIYKSKQTTVSRESAY